MSFDTKSLNSNFLNSMRSKSVSRSSKLNNLKKKSKKRNLGLFFFKNQNTSRSKNLEREFSAIMKKNQDLHLIMKRKR